MALRFHSKSEAADAFGYVTGFELKSDAEALAAVARERGNTNARVSTYSAVVMTSDHSPVVINITRAVFDAEAVDPLPANHEPDFIRVYAQELPAA